jgi:hypothetical protein
MRRLRMLRDDVVANRSLWSRLGKPGSEFGTPGSEFGKPGSENRYRAVTVGSGLFTPGRGWRDT